ncbi:MAG: copper resistance system multicopper oxidase [Gammaproteobacteria bacterium]
MTRRTVLRAGAAAMAWLGWRGTSRAASTASATPTELPGPRIHLRIGETPVNLTGRERTAVTVNGTLPAPLLRWREGDTVTIDVENTLDEDTSIHWHGLLLPANMDGVPGLSFKGIPARGTFQYRFTLRQSGTYWYHSHSAFQEQLGLYGPIVIEPRDPEPLPVAHDYVVMLSDWTDERPATVLAHLKKDSGYYNFNKRTVVDFVRDVRREGLDAAVQDRLAWGRMRMTPTDLADVTGYTYTHLVNGHTSAQNWTGLFRRGERIRLRFINGSAASYYDVRIPGLRMTVVAADGQPVTPVEVDEFRIAVAETYDVIVTPSDRDAYTIFAQAFDRTDFVRATLAEQPGLAAPVPPLDPRPLISMADMGHGGHHGHAAHAAHGDSGMQSHPASEDGNPLIDMQTMTPSPRLADAGIGLRGNGRRVLTYADLRSAFEDPDGREPARTIELHLTGHMERFAWSFDGLKFADAGPLELTYGERVRIVLVNDTMMSHPIHLHGLWSDLEDEEGRFLVRKHTIDMPPGTRRSYRVTADALGHWAYHCHILYHMETGMFRVVRVTEPGRGA